MTIAANQHMKDLLGADATHPERIQMPVPNALTETLEEGFKEVDSCIVPASFPQEAIWSPARPRVDNLDDETGFECLLSHVHVDDPATSVTNAPMLTRMAIAYAFLVRSTLERSGIAGNIRFIVGTELPSAETARATPSCTVRFHRIRPGQAWLSDNLEAYGTEALLGMDFVLNE